MPNDCVIEALFHEGTRQMAAGDWGRAEDCFRQAISHAPDVAGLHANLGILQERHGNTRDAEASYKLAIKLDPGLAEIHCNLAVLLVKLKRFTEAEQAYDRALALGMESAVMWSNLGVFYACMKREAEAESFYRKAMELAPDYALARFNLSYLLLRQGRFSEGWVCLEARSSFLELQRYLAIPRWQGEPLAGQAILIGAEAGYGDMIQFCRYATNLKAKGAARVGLLCYPALKSLLASLVDVDEVIALDAPQFSRAWDYWVPPMSIPRYCQTQLATIPAHLPYLNAPLAKIQQWQKRIPQEGMRVGLAWKGSQRHENDADRSLPALDLLTPLSEVAGVQLISLQKGLGEGDIQHPPSDLAIQLLGHEIQDFADTAAIIENLDLVITVDTAVAHLAGALGKPCWVLLPDYKTDWRWLTERTDSPWYPGVVRLFRQRAEEGWPAVIAEVKAALLSVESSARINQSMQSL